MPFTIIRQDITKMRVDAIVNAANVRLQMGGGVCGAIFTAAGPAELQVACDRLSPIEVGEAIVTPGFRLPAKYIIHTAGPVYRGGDEGEEEQLRLSYINSLKRAVEHKCESVAFPLISSGIYGYPKDQALKVASEAIKTFLDKQELHVYLAVFDKEAFKVSEKLLGEIGSYIDEHYVDEYRDLREKKYLTDRGCMFEPARAAEQALIYEDFDAPSAVIDSLVDNLDEPFSETLLRIIDKKGMTDVEVYKRANLDRRLFSKIRTGKGYMPGKRTVIALAVALRLSHEETVDLLERAGYALSKSQKFDVIIEYFIMNNKYDVFEINEVLFKYDQQLLGG